MSVWIGPARKKRATPSGIVSACFDMANVPVAVAGKSHACCFVEDSEEMRRVLLQNWETLYTVENVGSLLDHDVQPRTRRHAESIEVVRQLPPLLRLLTDPAHSTLKT